jgi:hypothetical protein
MESHNESGLWKRLVMPLTSFWIVLITLLIVGIMVAPSWLDSLARSEPDPQVRSRQQEMWETRLVMHPQTTDPPVAGPIGAAIAAERAGQPETALKTLAAEDLAPTPAAPPADSSHP